MSKQIEFHPIANIFPLIEEGSDEWVAFVANIKEKGLRVPMVLHENKILDGRNRYRACLELGIKPSFLTPSIPDPLDFVITRNLHRRHLTPSQVAMIAAELLPKYREEAVERKHANLKRGTENSKNTEKSPNVAPATFGDSEDLLARAFGISGDTIRRAEEVIESGSARVIAAARAGDVSVTDAAKIADEPKAAQAAALAAVESGEAKTLAGAVANRKRGRPKGSRNTPKGDKPPAESTTDQYGVDIPPSARKVFADLPRFKEFENLLGELAALGRGIVEDPCGKYIASGPYEADIKTMRTLFAKSKPHAVCPYCQGKKASCDGCDGDGWVNELIYKQSPGKGKR